MKTGWQRRPDNWPAWLQIATALMCVLPAIASLFAGQNVFALACAVGGFAFWCWLGRRTTGFPLLFDTLGMQVLLASGAAALIATIRLIRILVTS
ncbi:hypothetical protein SAMN06265222_12518 [Neorhodopirellula lusitana]|uniref:Uncharacterized protein n=1 Tax=Neorhodopirellula lusitana TaxID=445327 RepID=A0ABY1QRL4_9BACT|nr:hypothetical protein [Neorhodopirellula lusitana]SMP78260.1 hypothetical protein SAMN06265222_12518 [Neorhodopirellula lusitana]